MRFPFKPFLRYAVSASALMCALGVSNTALAGSQAGFQRIENQLNRCADQARVASGFNFCVQEALGKYEKQFTRSQKAQYRQYKEMCIAKFGRPDDLSAADASDSLECMHTAAKAVAKRK